MKNVFNTREIKINMSKEKILKNDMPFQFSHSILIFWDIGFQMEWINNGSTNFVIYQRSFLPVIL